MSDGYEFVGYVPRKKSTGGGHLAALMLIAIIGTCIQTNRRNGNAQN